MKNINKLLSRAGVAVGAVTLAVTSGSVFAAGAADAATQITAVGTDVSTIGWAVLGVLVVAAGFKYMRRAI